jgi:hypothetical protein
MAFAALFMFLGSLVVGELSLLLCAACISGNSSAQFISHLKVVGLSRDV